MFTGSEAGNAIAHHPLVRKLGFTGSTEVGQVIMKSCAESNLKKVSLELGGKSPLVIFNDCDLDKAVRLVSYNFDFFSCRIIYCTFLVDFRECNLCSSIKEKTA